MTLAVTSYGGGTGKRIVSGASLSGKDEMVLLVKEKHTESPRLLSAIARPATTAYSGRGCSISSDHSSGRLNQKGIVTDAAQSGSGPNNATMSDRSVQHL